MKLSCPTCTEAGSTGAFRVLETRGTDAMILRTLRCGVCGVRVVTCEAIIPDGLIPSTVRRNYLKEQQA